MRRSYAVWRAFWSDRRAAVAAVFLLVEIALVLFLFIMLINATLNFFLKRDKEG